MQAWLMGTLTSAGLAARQSPRRTGPPTWIGIAITTAVDFRRRKEKQIVLRGRLGTGLLIR